MKETEFMTTLRNLIYTQEEESELAYIGNYNTQSLHPELPRTTENDLIYIVIN